MNKGIRIIDVYGVYVKIARFRFWHKIYFVDIRRCEWEY